MYNMGDVLSDTLPISTGVPQGSILGPLQFLLYVNDIHLASNKFNAILYADDTTLVGPLCSYKYNRNINDNNNNVSNHINAELTEISDWLSSNKLSLNAPKTKYMLFHFPQRRITDIDLSLKIYDQRIDRKLEYKHDYPERLLHLKLESLELRRLYNDIIMVYTIVHKLTRLNDDVLLLSYHTC